MSCSRYGRYPRPLLVFHPSSFCTGGGRGESWTSPRRRGRASRPPHRTTLDHVEQVRDHMAQVWPIVRDHIWRAQQAQARVYDRGAQLRVFQPGELVLVLVPTAECKFLAKWQGPYEVVDRVGEVNYRVRQPGRRKPHPTIPRKHFETVEGGSGSTRPGIPGAGVPTGNPRGPGRRGPQPGPRSKTSTTWSCSTRMSSPSSRGGRRSSITTSGRPQE